MPWFGTLTGRLGVTVDHALLYVKAGGAWARFNHDIATGFPLSVLPPFFADSARDNRLGFTVGVGVEYAFWGNWSAKVEYDYMDFGSKNVEFVSSFVGAPIFGPPLALNQFADDRERVHVVKAGLNYRFWWGKAPTPVTAKY